MCKKVVFGLILNFVCIWALTFTSQAQEDTESETGAENVLHVAIPTPSSGMGDETSSSYIGYTEEYLHEVSQYTGWKYEVIEVSGAYERGLQSALDMLRAGTVDLVAPVALSGENADTGLYYSQNSFVTTSVELQVPNVVYEGEGLKEDVRVAVMDGSGLEDLANEFFTRNKITPQYVVCQNAEEQIEAVCSGKADVMLNSTLEHIPEMSVVAEFSPRSLHFVAGDQDLMRELDNAIMDMRQANVLFAQELYEEYIIGVSQVLTLEETAFIEQSEPYVVAILDHNAPYQYMDEETGKYQGVGMDLLNYIAQETGLQFEFVLAGSWDELTRLLEEGKVQIVAAMPHDHGMAASRDLTLTRSYATSPYVLVSHRSFSGADSEKRLALTEDSTYTDGYYVGEVHRYPTIEECMEAVRTGEADYTYTDLYTARYYLGDSRYKSLEFKTQSYTPRSLCFGLARHAPSELLSVLNKSINQLSATDIQNIITQNINPSRQTSLFDVIIDYPMQSLLVICTVSLLIASLLVFLLWRKEKMRKVLHKKAMEDGLTNLYNAAACRKLVTKKLRLMREEQTGAFIIMDMDDFKEVNDGYGHQTGDRVLQELAGLLRDILRADSVIARIGGDEFVAFLPSVEKEENILSICDRIRSEAHFICAGDRSITLSIGAVPAKAHDDYDTLYRLADKALYEVKADTKDKVCFAERDI